MRDYETTNRSEWDRTSAEYQARHEHDLRDAPDAWGTWRIPEAELRVLGDVDGLDVLELGCGAAQWSIHLARNGARAVGLDLSSAQLSHARRLLGSSEARVPLVQASAAAAPFAGESFDVVFCDHGAMSFADPYDTVPEAARLLRGGGLFAFCISSALFLMCIDPKEDRLDERLHGDYFGMRRFTWPGESTVDFQIPHGEWLRLFRDNGLDVEDLVEVRAPERATSTYRTEAERAWSRRWPAEEIWRLRKR